MWRLTLYSKPGCCLCDEAKAAIQEFSREWELQLEEIDITRDDALFQKYRDDIPVLFLNGQELARHRIGIKKLRVLRARQLINP